MSTHNTQFHEKKKKNIQCHDKIHERKFSEFLPNICFYAPAIFNGEGGAYSITAVHTYVRPSRPSRPSVRPVRNTFGFRAISFERICVLD